MGGGERAERGESEPNNVERIGGGEGDKVSPKIGSRSIRSWSCSAVYMAVPVRYSRTSRSLGSAHELCGGRDGRRELEAERPH